MDAFIIAFAVACAFVVAGLSRFKQKPSNKDEIMAAIDRLNTATAALQVVSGEVAGAVGRVITLVEDLQAGNSPTIEAAAVSVEGANALLATLRDQLNAKAPPQP